MTAVTRILETLLEKLRKQEITLTEEMAGALREAGEVISTQSAIHRNGGKVDAKIVSAICLKLEQFLASANLEDQDDNAGRTGAGDKDTSGSQADDPDYGFFGQQPKGRPNTETQDDQEDYGFFRDR